MPLGNASGVVVKWITFEVILIDGLFLVKWKKTKYFDFFYSAKKHTQSYYILYKKYLLFSNFNLKQQKN